jgi:hypothetical protein
MLQLPQLLQLIKRLTDVSNIIELLAYTCMS